MLSRVCVRARARDSTGTTRERERAQGGYRRRARLCPCVRRASVYARYVCAYVRPRYIMYESVLVGKRPPLARRGLT